MPSRFLLFLRGHTKKGSGREGSGVWAAQAAQTSPPTGRRRGTWAGAEAPGELREAGGSSPARGPAWRGVEGANRAHCTGNHCPLQAASQTPRQEPRGSLSPEKLANPTSRAGDHSSRTPPAAVQAVQVRAGASARTRATGVRRGSGGEALGSTAPLGEGGQESRPAAALQVRASKSAPGETAPAAAGPTAAAMPDTPARPQRDLLGHSLSN